MKVIPQAKLIVLDTNALIHLERANKTGVGIEASYGLKARSERPILSTVVEAEVLKLVTQWNWGASKLGQLGQTFTNLVRVSAGEPDIVRAYAELAVHQEGIGKKIGENDLWIAATARAVGAVVLTCDTDFLNLDPAHVDIAYFDVESCQPGW